MSSATSSFFIKLVIRSLLDILSREFSQLVSFFVHSQCTRTRIIDMYFRATATQIGPLMYNEPYVMKIIKYNHYLLH